MGMPSEDVVVVQHGKNADELCVITVNCPDKMGLGSDLCRIIFEFGLSITKADVSTDGKWCYVILWVVPPLRSMRVTKKRLPSICPSCLIPFYFESATLTKPSQVYLLKSLSFNRRGLLHDVTQVLSDLELTIHKVKVSTMPDGRVMDLFFITDGMQVLSLDNIDYHLKIAGKSSIINGAHHVNCLDNQSMGTILQNRKHYPICTSSHNRTESSIMQNLSTLAAQIVFPLKCQWELLHTKRRQVDKCEQLNTVLEDSCLSCELQLAGPEYKGFQQGFSCLPPAVAEELFSSKLSDDETCLQALTPELTPLKKSKISMDNSLSPSHTLLQIHCVDQKSLLYDITRTLKDFNIKISYSRFSSNKNGCREVDLFIRQMDGKNILDPGKQSVLSSSLRMEILHPLRVVITSRGPDTELLVANPVELSGKGMPHVFYGVTGALKMLGICIFLAEIGRHSTSNRAWEVYRFFLDENCEFPLANSNTRTQIVARVRRSLMVW